MKNLPATYSRSHGICRLTAIWRPDTQECFSEFADRDLLLRDSCLLYTSYPPLIKTDMVLNDKDKLIEITLNGLSGKIEVNGKIYNNIMPPHSHLSDKQIADVLTYVRKSFGNNASEVTVEEVQKVRNK